MESPLRTVTSYCGCENRRNRRNSKRLPKIQNLVDFYKTGSTVAVVTRSSLKVDEALAGYVTASIPSIIEITDMYSTDSPITIHRRPLEAIVSRFLTNWRYAFGKNPKREHRGTHMSPLAPPWNTLPSPSHTQTKNTIPNLFHLKALPMAIRQ